jgi:hypothetical protein
MNTTELTYQIEQAYVHLAKAASAIGAARAASTGDANLRSALMLMANDVEAVLRQLGNARKWVPRGN